MKIIATCLAGATAAALLLIAFQQKTQTPLLKADAGALQLRRPGALAVRKSSPVRHEIFQDEKAASRLCVPEEKLRALRDEQPPPSPTLDPAIPGERQVLLLKRRIVIPEGKSNRRATTKLRQSPSPRGTAPRIVMTDAALESTWANAMPGVKIRGYLPSRAWLAETTDDGAKNLLLHPNVVAVEEWLPSDKTHPGLDGLLGALAPSEMLKLTVRFFDAADFGALEKIVSGNGGTVISRTSHRQWSSMRIVAPAKSIPELAGSGSVQWIEEAPNFSLSNARAVLPDALNVTNVWFASNFTGSGQTIGHADTGIDKGKMEGLHPDFTNSVVAFLAYARNSASDPHGHGTHTAGSIVGDGSAGDGSVRGCAWQAKLVHQSIVDEYGYFCNFNTYSLFADAFEYGAKIHSDSWGDSINLAIYNSECHDVDLFVWEHPDFLPVFAAGNSGTDDDGNGVIDFGSVSSPSCAKNVISVGAAENHHASGTGGYSRYSWSSFTSSLYNRNYSAEPIKSDLVTTSADRQDGLRGLAAFSGRGPAADGRIKPDLVAPGSDIYSCRSSLTSGSGRYDYDIGTSMATPLVAGCAALVRQYLTEKQHIADPSAALVKAMLINGAKSLSPGQYGTGAYREIPAVSPNNAEGWGMVDMGRTLTPDDGTSIRVVDRLEAGSGSPYSLDITLTESGKPFSATLSWTDYPGTPGSANMLVDDLDLVVTGPDGSIFYPNSEKSADRLNTIETVRIPAAPAGRYRIEVSAYALPYAAPPAALVMSGAIDRTDSRRTLTVKMVNDSNPEEVFKEYSIEYGSSELASTPVAPAHIWVDSEEESAPYIFCGWEIDGIRQPSGNATAYDQATGILMNSNRVATARYEYMFSEEPLDGGYFIYTWWNKRYFGGSGSSSQLAWLANPDGDRAYNFEEMFDYTDPRDANDLPAEPQISVNTLPVFNPQRCPWPVIATITDNFIVADAHLLWRQKGESEWRRTQMIQFTDTQWGAYLDPPNLGNFRIDYCVAASDWYQYNLGTETVSPVYSVIGEYPVPWPQLEPETIPPLTMFGEKARIDLVLENLAGADLEWSARISSTPGGEWAEIAGDTQGTLVSREKRTIAVEIDSSKLAENTNGICTIAISHNEPGEEIRTIKVKRLPFATERHGVPVKWMIEKGIECDDYELAAESDLDGDGMATWQEWHADTDPLDAESVLSILAFESDGNSARIKWRGGRNATQFVESASTPTGRWNSCTIVVPPVASTNTISIPVLPQDDARYFRISVPIRSENSAGGD